MSDAQAPDQGATHQKATKNPLIKLALELGPLVIFFFVNARGQSLIDRYESLQWFREPIFLATAVFMVAITISLIASRIYLGKLPIMPVVSGVVVLFFGALTLFLHDDLFIKLKPTIVNMLFATVLLGGLWIFKLSLLSYVFDDAFNLKEEGWRILTLRWGLFFIFLAVLNEVVWRTQTTDFWVAFKVWGVMPITFAFTLFQIPVMNRYAEHEEEEEAAT
ncbi:septation protein A [Ahrensia marina]|uniref:septation protein A n=1 Tax=Ahrensia marina TaxID=1514904 RepID=UPI0035D1021B